MWPPGLSLPTFVLEETVFLMYPVFTCACSVCSGTPTEHTWPGISSNDEFVAYNYPQYRADRLSNHTPRYTAALLSNYGAVCSGYAFKGQVTPV